MKRLGVIGGTGSELLGAADTRTEAPARTPFGMASTSIWSSRLAGGVELCFLARHGSDGSIPPHRVNYRANLWLLHQQRVDAVVGINAVGGIATDCEPGLLVLPEQLIDYTWGRDHSYAGEAGFGRLHVEFTHPIAPALHRLLAAAADAAGVPCIQAGVYGVTQGPRLESAAEIDRLARDGCTVVGMTAMPEAGLAAELGVPYAICAPVVNRAAGRGGDGALHDQIHEHLRVAMNRVDALLHALARVL